MFLLVWQSSLNITFHAPLVGAFPGTGEAKQPHGKKLVCSTAFHYTSESPQLTKMAKTYPRQNLLRKRDGWPF